MSSHDSYKICDPFIQRNVKLLPCQKEMVVYWHEKKGLSKKEIAEIFKCSRQAIYYILNPEKMAQNNAAKKTSRIKYYDTEKNTSSQKKCRELKNSLSKFKKNGK